MNTKSKTVSLGVFLLIAAGCSPEPAKREKWISINENSDSLGVKISRGPSIHMQFDSAKKSRRYIIQLLSDETYQSKEIGKKYFRFADGGNGHEGRIYPISPSPFYDGSLGITIDDSMAALLPYTRNFHIPIHNLEAGKYWARVIWFDLSDASKLQPRDYPSNQNGIDKFAGAIGAAVDAEVGNTFLYIYNKKLQEFHRTRLVLGQYIPLAISNSTSNLQLIQGDWKGFHRGLADTISWTFGLKKGRYQFKTKLGRSDFDYVCDTSTTPIQLKFTANGTKGYGAMDFISVDTMRMFIPTEMSPEVYSQFIDFPEDENQSIVYFLRQDKKGIQNH